MCEVRKSMRLLSTLLFFITFACSSICISPLYAKNLEEIQEIVVFGDSLSDTGNLYVATGDTFPALPPYDEGRFSNGLVWVEYLAEAMDLEKPMPSNEGGTNYAWGGAETGVGQSLVNELVPNIGEQINSFLESNDPTGNQLFILWAGANDFFMGDKDVKDIVDNIIVHIKTLALHSNPDTKDHKGETLQFMVANLPPLGQTPKVQWLSLGNFSLAEYVDGLSMAFNLLLDSELEKLKEDLKKDYKINLILYKLDVYSLFQEILDDLKYGFELDVDPETGVYKTVRGAITIVEPETEQIQLFRYPLDVGTPDPDLESEYVYYSYDPIDPDVSVFFDDMHPTTKVHEFIAVKALELIDGQIIETEYAD